MGVLGVAFTATTVVPASEVHPFNVTVTLYVPLIATVALDLAAVARAPSKPPWSEAPRVELVILEGIAESLAPAILGFALLSFVWMIGAVGQRRLARELDG